MCNELKKRKYPNAILEQRMKCYGIWIDDARVKRFDTLTEAVAYKRHLMSKMQGVTVKIKPSWRKWQ